MSRPKHTIRYTPVEKGYTAFIEQFVLIVTLTLTGCILLAMESTVFGRISLYFLGMGRAAPSLCLLFCMASGFLHGERIGAGYGLVMGFLADSMDYPRDGTGIMLLPLIYFLYGYLSGIVGKRRLAHNLPSFTVFAVIGGGIEFLLGILYASFQIKGFPPLGWIWQGLMPIWILTVIFSPGVYGLMYLEKLWMSHKKS